MDLNSPSVIGRKVFFLNLTVDVKERVVSVLREQEYEVYVMDSYLYAKDVLREYPNSVLFVQIDEHDDNELTVSQWFHFLKSFSDDEVLKTILLGVISRRISNSEKNYFMMNLTLPAGMFVIRNITDTGLDGILQVLQSNDAKGRRQYVRASCPIERDDYIFCECGGADVKLKIRDISCAGLSGILSTEKASLLKPKTLIKKATVYLEKHQPIHCNCAVYAVKPIAPTLTQIVLLILPTTSVIATNQIREHVFELLQNKLEMQISKYQPDKTKYSDEFGTMSKPEKSEDEKNSKKSNKSKKSEKSVDKNVEETEKTKSSE